MSPLGGPRSAPRVDPAAGLGYQGGVERVREAALTVAEVREYDRRASAELGLPSAVLMENAGRAAAEEIAACVAPGRIATGPARVGEVAAGGSDAIDPPRVVILVGPGNNGGDGYVIARHLLGLGARPELYSSATRESLRGDASLYRGVCDRLGLATREVVTAHQLDRERGRWRGAVAVVDALLGTGFRGELRPHLARLLAAVAELPDAGEGGPLRVAIDVPTGLEADSGRAAAGAFRADLTVSFVAPKPGFARADGPRHVGRLAVRGIGLPPELPGGAVNSGGASAG